MNIKLLPQSIATDIAVALSSSLTDNGVNSGSLAHIDRFCGYLVESPSSPIIEVRSIHEWLREELEEVAGGSRGAEHHLIMLLDEVCFDHLGTDQWVSDVNNSGALAQIEALYEHPANVGTDLEFLTWLAAELNAHDSIGAIDITRFMSWHVERCEMMRELIASHEANELTEQVLRGDREAVKLRVAGAMSLPQYSYNMLAQRAETLGVGL